MTKTLAGFVLLMPVAVSAWAQDGSRVRTTMARGMELPYEVVDGLAVYAGDIILGRAEEVAARTADSSPLSSGRLPPVSRALPSRYDSSGLFCIWPNGIRRTAIWMGCTPCGIARGPISCT